MRPETGRRSDEGGFQGGFKGGFKDPLHFKGGFAREP